MVANSSVCAICCSAFVQIEEHLGCVRPAEELVQGVALPAESLDAFLRGVGQQVLHEERVRQRRLQEALRGHAAQLPCGHLDPCDQRGRVR